MELFELRNVAHKESGFLSTTTVLTVMEVGLQDTVVLKERSLVSAKGSCEEGSQRKNICHEIGERDWQNLHTSKVIR